MNGHFIKKRLGVFTAVTLACVIVAGCTPKAETIEVKKSVNAATHETSDEQNIKTVEAVLQQELNAPDKEYIQLVKEAMGGTKDQDSVEQKENEMKLNSYIKEKYLPYFTEDGFNKFQGTDLHRYHYITDEEYSIRLIESEVKKSEVDTASNQYHIKAVVELTVPGEEPSTHELEGIAIFSKEEGKIGAFQLGQQVPTMTDKIAESINGTPTLEKTAIEQIEAVLENVLNGPDKEFQKLAQAAMGGTENDESAEHREDIVKLENYLSDKYQPYFTEDGLKQFSVMGALQYHYYFDADYELKLVDTEVKQSEVDTASNQYHIKAVVELISPNQEPSTHTVEGRAIISKKEGKIGDFYLGQKEQTLHDQLNELDNSQ